MRTLRIVNLLAVAMIVIAVVLPANPSEAADLAKADTNSWSLTESMIGARSGHTATLLPSGKLLVVGGSSGVALASAEIYDPVKSTWSPAANMSVARVGHTATLLNSGKVLVAGGCTLSAEVYNPASNTWTSAGSMGIKRGGPTATLLPSGKVLVVGGWDCSGSNAGLSSAELYDPGMNSWSTAASMSVRRGDFAATLLPSGKVLVVGGWSLDGWSGLSSAELYDPNTNTWSLAASMDTPRESHCVTLLPSGKVLVEGGGTTIHPNLASAQLYDPASNTWSPAASMNVARGYHSATLLPSGKVLVAGGAGGSYSNTTLASAELYDPASNTWSSVPNMSAARLNQTAILLNSGFVLVAGGGVMGSSTGLASVELFGSGFKISGQVIQTDGTPISGVTLLAGTTRAFSDSNGTYTLSNLSAGTYTVTPIKPDMRFSPPSMPVTITNTDMVGQNFTGTQLVSSFSVSGHIATFGGYASPDVTVSIGNTSALTDASGNFYIYGLAPGDYLIIPTKPGYSFLPASRPLTVTNDKINGQNFVSTIQNSTSAGEITAPLDNSTIGDQAITFSANATTSNPLGIRNVFFSVFYNGSWHYAAIDSLSPYQMSWRSPAGLESQQLHFSIDVTDHDGNTTPFADVHTVSFIDSLNDLNIIEKWVPNRVYLNQWSLQPGDNQHGYNECSAASMTMVLAMEGAINSDYATLSSKANEMYKNMGYVASHKKISDELNTHQGMVALDKYYSIDDGWTTIKQEVNAGRPVIVRTGVNMSDPDGHYIVAVGYKEAYGGRALIAYDPYGHWTGSPNVWNSNTKDQDSYKGKWVFYNFGAVFGEGDYLITVQRPQAAFAVRQVQTALELSSPDVMNDEPQDIENYIGLPEGVSVFLPLITR